MSGDPSTHYTFRARPVDVTDGDTFDLYIDQGFNSYRLITVRLNGVDTAEIYGVKKESDEYQLGAKQKRFVADWLEADEEHDGWPLNVRTLEKGKYGRWVANVWKGQESLSETIIEKWPDAESSY